jgi:hypothetical protein
MQRKGKEIGSEPVIIHTERYNLVSALTFNHTKGPFGTAPAPDSKRGSGGAVPNGYFFKLILVWSRKIGSRFCEEM